MTAPEDAPAWARVLDIAAEDVPPSDAFARMFAHELGGVILRDSVPEALRRSACARLEELEAPADVRLRPIVSDGDVPVLEVLGHSLRLSPWKDYSAVLAPVRAIHAALFGDPEGLEPILRRRISALCGGTEPAPLRDATGGAPFGRCLLNTLHAGGTIPYHFDNYVFHENTEFARIRPLVDQTTLINALTILQTPEGGGTLDLATYDWAEYRARTGRNDSNAWHDRLVEGRRVQRLDLRAGDTLVFDAGRIAHQVSPVSGARARHSYFFHLARRADGEICYFV